MTTFTYNCKKTGQSIDVTIESLPAPSLAYVIRRGLREYFDNYHASETLAKHSGDANILAAKVSDMVQESFARLMAGDVPGERVPTDPAVIRVRKLVAEAKAAGVDAEAVISALIAKAHKKAA